MHVTGNPWVISGSPAPNPRETRTCARGYGYQVWVPMGYMSQAITPLQPPLSLHHLSRCAETPFTQQTPPLHPQQHDNTMTEGGTMRVGWAVPSPIIGNVFFNIILLYIVLINHPSFAGTTT